MSIEKINLTYVRQENKSFTTLYNEVIQNINDAFSLGVYCYLSSLPHDWIVNKKQLMNHFNVGRDKMVSTMSWLNKNHLISYEQERTQEGKMGKHIIIVRDGIKFVQSIDKSTACRKSRLPEKPLTGKSAPTNININTNEIEKKKQKIAQPKSTAALDSENIVLPDWLKIELWEDFKQHRKEMKKPMSELSQKKAINLLDKMRAKGQDVESVINNSIANGWQGLFELKQQRKELVHGTSNVVSGPNGLECATKDWNSMQWDILKEGCGLSRDADLSKIKGLIPGEVWDDLPDPRADIRPSKFMGNYPERHLE